MLEPRRLTSLGASTACYIDSLLLLLIYVSATRLKQWELYFNQAAFINFDSEIITYPRTIKALCVEFCRTKY
jgi:hypothetical protein